MVDLVAFSRCKVLLSMTIVAVISVCCLLLLLKENKLQTHDVQLVNRRKLEIKWGDTFGGLAPCDNVKFDCLHNGKKVCCGLLTDDEEAKSNATTTRGVLRTHSLCKIEKKYIPSAYETAHINKAEELSKMESDTARKEELLKFIHADIPASNLWLARVKAHLASEDNPTSHPDDIAYLSRFEVTKTCASEELGTSWVEWIEPLTVHTRHPFSMIECGGVYSTDGISKMLYPAKLQSLDYILIQSGKNLHEATSMSVHNHSRFAAHHNHHLTHREDHIQTHNYILDAGTSTFESSMVWFLCAYLQRKIAFDQEYGFEYTLLEPQDFWKRVPDSVKPFYHFFNAPIAPHVNDSMSPLRFIKKFATPEDFVAFKLDVDTPELEIPLALALAKHEDIARLVDEFFFELHYRCEILMHCGWGQAMPKEYMGLKLERYHAMKFFQSMREQGIRAHFWP